MKNTTKNILQEVKAYIILTIAVCISSFGWSAFLIPSDIIGGGITGLSSTFYFLWGWNVGVTSLVINLFLIALALKILGLSYGIKTIYCIVIFSIALSIFTEHFKEPLLSNIFTNTIIGAALGGGGTAILFIYGGSTGGTEIIAMIINKFKNISLGRLLLALDIIIISSSYVVFHDIERIVYGLITMGIYTYCLDLVISGNKQSIQIFIISNKPNELTEAFTIIGNKGVTIIDAIGGYTKENRKILMVVSKKRTSSIVFKLIKEIDPKAFVTMGSVSGVYGENFEQIRG